MTVRRNVPFHQVGRRTDEGHVATVGAQGRVAGVVRSTRSSIRRHAHQLRRMRLQIHGKDIEGAIRIPLCQVRCRAGEDHHPAIGTEAAGFNSTRTRRRHRRQLRRPSREEFDGAIDEICQEDIRHAIAVARHDVRRAGLEHEALCIRTELESARGSRVSGLPPAGQWPGTPAWPVRRRTARRVHRWPSGRAGSSR